jgi:hypothetical protein
MKLTEEYRELARAIRRIADRHFGGEVEPVIAALAEGLAEDDDAHAGRMPF